MISATAVRAARSESAGSGQWEECAFFNRSYDEAASHVPYARNASEFLHREGAISGKVLHHHMQQKIGLAGGDVACDHFGQFRHGLYKCVRVGIAVTFNIHANKRDYAQADFVAIEARSVTFDETVFLKPANPAQAGRRGEANALRQLKIRKPRMGLKGRQDSDV